MVILGIDEVGRGSWAGPIVVGAVILTKKINGLKDSKQLTKSKREMLYFRIIKSCPYATGWAWPREIDKYGLSKSLHLAGLRAINQINYPYDQILLDGNFNYLKNPNCQTIIKGDQKVKSIAAASIVAKVSRDFYMYSVNEVFRGYQFNTNVGYGSKYHQAKIKLSGISEIHRKSYKPIIASLRYANR